MSTPNKSKTTKNKTNNKSIVIFSAHSDDFVIGVGGTIAFYKEKGYKVYCYVFSYGENSHPWVEGKKVQNFRSHEAFEAAKVLGCDCKFFDLKELNFTQDAKKTKLKAKLKKIIEKINPEKIFTHSSEDPHPDHQAVNDITLELYDSLKSKPQILSYSVWNPVEFKTRHPALIISIKTTFKLKMVALHKFPSQRFNAIYPLMFFIWFRAIRDGWIIKSRFAEKFYLIRKGD